jgi:hypothetical protein
MMKWFWIAFVGLLISSCLDEPDCLRLADTALVINFKKLSNNAKDTVILYTIVAESQGEAADSVFYDKGNEPEKDTIRSGAVIVAVNPFANETRFTFHFVSGDKYLLLGYKTTSRFVSEDCGSELIVSSLSVLETDLDSVRVVNRVLTTKRLVNIEILN